jgi:hypothetical protein
MGLNYNNIKWLLYSKNNGIIFDNTAMIGRQGLHIKKEKLEKIFNNYGLKANNINDLFFDNYSDNLLKFLGAKNLDSFDFSNYENANIIHDFNKPIDDAYKNKYDLVMDGGTLEHVFNFPTAIKNCMEMISIGGYFVSMTICNNFSGHGFYQFSPELFFRIFSKENGFSVTSIVIEEGGKWFLVNDPDVIKERVTFRNNKETSLMILAKKESDVDIFIKNPLQSDYVEIWNNGEKTNTNSNKLALHIKKIFKMMFVKYDKKFFKRIKV